MENQDNDDTYQAELDSSWDEEPRAGFVFSASQDLNGEAEDIWDVEEDPLVSTRYFEDDQRIQGEAFGMAGDQAVREGAVPNNHLRPQNITNLGQNILEFPFPIKLWMMVEDDTINSVYWGENGDTIIIEEELFQGEVLQRRDSERIFETDSLKTFIRLLHIHGFKKIGLSYLCNFPEKKRVKVYSNPNFLKDQPHLIDNIQRKSNRGIAPFPDVRMAILKRNMMEASGNFPQFLTGNFTQDDPDVQTEVKAQGPEDPQSSMVVSNIYTSLMETCTIIEGCGKRKEGMSRNSSFESVTDDAIQDLGLSSSLPRSTDEYPMTAPCNNSPNETSGDEDEPEEGPSDYYFEL